MGLDFVAIDFETANPNRSSACSVGVVRVRGGQVVDRRYWLIRPHHTVAKFGFHNTRVHGITAQMVADQPTFSDLFSELSSFIGGDDLVAHNASFDAGVLAATSHLHDLTPPVGLVYCSLSMSRCVYQLPSYSLNYVASHVGAPLTDHHHALADAEACAHVTIALAAAQQSTTLPLLAESLAGMPMYRAPRTSSGTGRGGRQKPLVAAETNSAADPDGYLYGQTVVFTGTLPAGLTRQQAWDAVAAVGGIPEQNVTKRTNVLVVGDLDPRTLSPGAAMSGKAKKAAELQTAGQQIEVMSGMEFLTHMPSATQL